MEFSLAHYLPVVRLSYHQISFFPRSYSYYNRNKRFELIKLLENQELLNECGIYFCTGIYFFKLAKKGGNDFSPLPPLSSFQPNPSAHFIFLLFIPQHRTRLHHPPHRMTQCQSGNNHRKYHRCRSNNNSPRHRACHSKSQARRSRCTPRHSR